MKSKNIKELEKELNDKFYLDMQICHVTITHLSQNKVSLKLFKNIDDKKVLTSLNIVNLHIKGFENFLKNPKTNLSLNITNKDKMESWKFSVISKDKFLVDIDSEYCAFLTKEDIQKIVDGLTIKKRDILGESRVLTFDEFVSGRFDNLGDFINMEPSDKFQSSSKDDYLEDQEDELLFDIHDEPINFSKNVDRYDSKKNFNWSEESDLEESDLDDCYFDCYDSDDDFESDIENYFGLDFYDEIEEIVSYTKHGNERLEERGISKSIIDKILDSCKMRLFKLKNELGKKILIRSTKEDVSIVGKLERVANQIKFKVITAIQGIGLKYDDDYNLIKI